jgi:hypothetical protein
MSRRKGEITERMYERDFPHIVELAVPSGGHGSRSAQFDAFYRDRKISIRRRRGRHEGAPASGW